MIKHINGKWNVLNHDGTKLLGSYDTKVEAIKRLKQIEYFTKPRPISKKRKR